MKCTNKSNYNKRKITTTVQYFSPRELQECVSNMRLLTWILQGSLSHIVNSKTVHAACQPIALEENVNVAKYVAIILHSFAEPLKVRVFSLFIFLCIMH